MNYAYTNIKKNLQPSQFWENFLRNNFLEKKNPKKPLSTCIKSSLKRTNRYKLIKLAQDY